MASPQTSQAALNAVYVPSAGGDPELATTAVAGTPSKAAAGAYLENFIWGAVLAADGAHLNVIKVN